MPVKKDKVITTSEWIIVKLIMLVPLVNIIMLFVWAFGDNSNLSKYIDSHKGKNYDFIIIQDLLCTFNNIYESLEEIKKVTNNNTRLIFTYVSPIWLPIIKIAEIFKIIMN